VGGGRPGGSRHGREVGRRPGLERLSDAGYLHRGLAVINEAIERGIDVRGIFHWTAVDNYEWLHGYDVSFGIIDRDRTVRPSALVLENEALPPRSAP